MRGWSKPLFPFKKLLRQVTMKHRMRTGSFYPLQHCIVVMRELCRSNNNKNMRGEEERSKKEQEEEEEEEFYFLGFVRSFVMKLISFF